MMQQTRSTAEALVPRIDQAKKQKNLTLTTTAADLIEKMSVLKGISQAGVVELAVRDLAERWNVQLKPRGSKPKRTSGLNGDEPTGEEA